MYHIPVSHIWIYEDKNERPDWSDQKEKELWIKNQSAVMEKVEETEIGFENFNWQLNKIIHTNEKGEKLFAVKVIGICSLY